MQAVLGESLRLYGGSTRRLAREEALFVGTSSGANVTAALREAKKLGPGGTVVTVLCDSGLKYLSTDLYRSAAD